MYISCYFLARNRLSITRECRTRLLEICIYTSRAVTTEEFYASWHCMNIVFLRLLLLFLCFHFFSLNHFDFMRSAIFPHTFFHCSLSPSHRFVSFLYFWYCCAGCVLWTCASERARGDSNMSLVWLLRGRGGGPICVCNTAAVCSKCESKIIWWLLKPHRSVHARVHGNEKRWNTMVRVLVPF